MQFSLETNNDSYIIRAYAPGEVIVTPPQDMTEKVERIQDERFGEQPIALEILTTTSLIMPRHLEKDWSSASYEELSAANLATLQQHQPEIILLGSGEQLRWPAKGVRESLLEKGIGVEVMDSGAACRTYNILIGEQRNVAAIIFI